MGLTIFLRIRRPTGRGPGMWMNYNLLLKILYLHDNNVFADGGCDKDYAKKPCVGARWAGSWAWISFTLLLMMIIIINMIIYHHMMMLLWSILMWSHNFIQPSWRRDPRAGLAPGLGLAPAIVIMIIIVFIIIMISTPPDQTNEIKPLVSLNKNFSFVPYT